MSPFHSPRVTISTKIFEEDNPCTYLCGNSLGLMPKRSRKLVEEELQVWGTRYSHVYPGSLIYAEENL